MKKPVLIVMIVVFTLIISNIAMAGGRYYRGHGGPYYGGHGGHGSHYPEVLLGGLIVGGIIGSQINNPYSRRPVYVNAYPVPVATGTSFLLKPNGDCFLISNSSSGNQILSSVPASNCQ